ncbi:MULTISPECIES: hypothetical protein [Maricaulis]|uniref:hypothetical protein n=1 Tax=Maricaulis TaxID=74317 RepID=UPI000C56ABA7|nr:hypothetical protein [Maricaulis sp.]MAC88542.1 hypothetical protein [Maricaulis sp.]
MSKSSNSPAPVPVDDEKRPVTKAEAAKESNALKVSQRICSERDRRLTPPKLKALEGAGGLTNNTGDGCDHIRLLDTFAVTNLAAAELLMRTLLESEDRSVARGDLVPTNGLLALIHALEPKDAAESMLCCQMVLTHMQIMECQRRANIDGQTFEGRDVNLRHAERFTRIYTQQLDALNKHRGKGQQKVTVEHVTVNKGGQAIVGNVEG